MASGAGEAVGGFAPRYLGVQHAEAVERVDLIPWAGGRVVVEFECSEFTSHCPVTRQPDFGSLLIRYEPRGSLIETKSLKLFLWGWRGRMAFNEVIVDELAGRLHEAASPAWLEVVGRFNARGGIAVTVRARRGEGAGAPSRSGG